MEPAPTPSSTATPTPPPEGSATVAIPHEPPTLDPFSAEGGGPATRDITRLLMPALWRTGPEGARTPWLLAAEPEREDARTLTISIRDDARWSDGKPITVTDLEHTHRYALEQRVDGYDDLAQIVQETPSRARLVFRERAPTRLTQFSDGLGVLPAHVPVEQLRRAWPVSGGPFSLRRWRSGLDITLEASAQPWGNNPHLEVVRFVFVPDAVGALELFRRGEVDVLGPYLAPDWTRRLTDVPSARISADTGQTYAVLLMSARASPFSDRRVRRALAHALDRSRLARGLVGDEGAPLDALPPGGVEGFDQYGDTAQARALLDRAGWSGSPRRKSGNTLDPTIAFTGDDLAYTIVRALQFQARQVGFDLQAVPLDADQLWNEWLQGGEQRAAVLLLRDPPEGERARFGIGLDDDASEVRALPLFALDVILAAREGIAGVCASASPDGPFWNAEAWARAETSSASCPTLVAPAA